MKIVDKKSYWDQQVRDKHSFALGPSVLWESFALCATYNEASATVFKSPLVPVMLTAVDR